MQQHLNRSFSRRIGKTLSKLQKDLLEQDLPNCLLSNFLESENNIQLPPKYESYIAEIGIGMGDHFIASASVNPSTLYIGFEPYLNGIANSLKLSKESSVKNISLWPDDMDLIFDKLPDDALSAIYILFPDPWPKSRHQKRRIVNPERLLTFTRKLKKGGKLNFASDIAEYFDYAREVVLSSGLFKEDVSSTSPYDGYVKTKYHIKAEESGRIPQFLSATKI